MQKNIKSKTKALLSGNEAIALGAYHAGLKVATAYPGTPSTEILENIARFEDVYAEWSTNEKVALEIALGASYAGARAIASMKHVGLNVAADPLLAASITGIKGGFIVISADDPGMHSSQNEQDNRHYARLAKIPAIEPYDSQSAYDFIQTAFDISENYDTPVLFRSSTRISHSKSVVIHANKVTTGSQAISFEPDISKFVMLPVFARARHPVIEQRIADLKIFAETCSLNEVIYKDKSLGIITSGIASQYAMEVFPGASILKLGLVYPLPETLIRTFAASVEKLVVIEELDSFLEDIVSSMGLRVSGKDFIPLTGELSPEIVATSAKRAGLPVPNEYTQPDSVNCPIVSRPPSLCPGCPHRGLFYVLNKLGKRGRGVANASKMDGSGLIITGDIGCYTLGAYPPLNSMDTCTCMGASIGQAIGMEKAGVKEKLVAVIGDSTFMHSGLTPLANAIYNQSKITIIILDNMTTAMTGHQGHPGTGISARGGNVARVDLEKLIRGMGVDNLEVLDSFDINEITRAVKTATGNSCLSVLIIRGECAPLRPRSDAFRFVESEKCTYCQACLKLACTAIQNMGGHIHIDSQICAGDNCGICDQVCPTGAITIKSRVCK